MNASSYTIDVVISMPLKMSFKRRTIQQSSFIFYELYEDEDALAYHNTRPYFKDVAAFFNDGGAEIVIKKATGKFMTN